MKTATRLEAMRFGDFFEADLQTVMGLAFSEICCGDWKGKLHISDMLNQIENCVSYHVLC